MKLRLKKRSIPNVLRDDVAGLALLFVFGCFALFGGGARFDIYSLLFLRPLGAIAFVTGLFALWRRGYYDLKPLLLLMAAVILVIGFQLIPLPAGLWTSLPGRDVYAEVARLTGTTDVAHPISLYPSLTENAFFAVLLPSSILLFFAAATERFRALALWAVLIFAGLSTVLGLLQLLGSDSSALYFYAITNKDSVVGLFANRNHQAALLAVMPPVLIWAALSLSRRKNWPLASAAGIWMIMGLLTLAGGSRSGLLFFLLSSFLSAFLVPRKVIERSRLYAKLGNRTSYAIGGGMAVLIGAVALISGRTNSAENLSIGEVSGDVRWEMYETTWTMLTDFFPVGGGGGTLVEVYGLYETPDMIRNAYVNHAHNDYLEIGYAYGLPGMLLIVAALLLVAVRAVKVWRWKSDSNHCLAARASSIGLLVLALFSVVDYPLRTPSLASVAVILAGTLFAYRSSHAHSSVRAI